MARGDPIERVSAAGTRGPKKGRPKGSRTQKKEPTPEPEEILDESVNLEAAIARAMRRESAAKEKELDECRERTAELAAQRDALPSHDTLASCLEELQKSIAKAR